MISEKYKVLLPVILVLFVLMPGSAYPNSTNEDSLRSALNSKNINKVLSVLNEIKESEYKGDILPFITILWNRDKTSEPHIDWKMLDYDIVRINLADILVQATNNNLIDIDLQDIHDYARKLLTGNDNDVVSAAVIVLAEIDDKRDVDSIRNLALKKNRYLFRSSVLALSMMCNADSGPALDAIGKTLTDNDEIAFLNTTRVKFNKLKMTGAFCPKKH